MDARAPDLPDGTATFVALDFVLPAEDGIATDWAAICRHALNTLVPKLAGKGGFLLPEQDEGHQLVFAFSRPTEALRALVDALRLYLKSGSAGPLPNLRGAIHTAEVFVEGGKYSGTAVETTLRLKDLCYANQLLVSLSARELIKGSAEESFQFVDLGVQSLQEESRFERIFQVCAPGLPKEFPALRSWDSALTNIRTPNNAFIGRSQEFFSLASKIQRCSKLTLIGCAGVGKSRLCLELGKHLLYRYPDGVFAVDFGDLADAKYLTETIANELPFAKFTSSDVAEALRTQISNRELLLILDNCDDFSQQVACFMDEILLNQPSCRVILTSREPLGYQEEQVVEVVPLPTGDTQDNSAAKLLMRRVEEVIPGATFVDPEVMKSVREVAATFEGIPLCLELAANRFKTLTASDILRQVRPLKSPARPKNLREFDELINRTILWSIKPLSENERTALYRAAVFCGGWESDAANWVCGGFDLAPEQVTRSMEGLVQNGLVNRIQVSPTVTREGLSHSLREFALGHLRLRQESRPIRQRLLEWLLSLSENVYGALNGHDQHQLLERLYRERHNIRIALEWALGQGNDPVSAYRVLIGTALYWVQRGGVGEGLLWAEALLEHPSGVNDDDRAALLNFIGALENAVGNTESAAKHLEGGLELSTKLMNTRLSAAILSNLGVSYRGKGDLRKAAQYFRKCVDAFRAIGDDARLAAALANLGAVHSELGEFELARITLHESLDISHEAGNQWVATMAGFNLAELALRQNSVHRAEPLLTESLNRWFNMKDYHNVAIALVSMADVSVKLGQVERAATLLGASSGIRSRLHEDLPAIENERHQMLVSQITERMTSKNFKETWSEAVKLSPEAAVHFALGPSVGSST